MVRWIKDMENLKREVGKAGWSPGDHWVTFLHKDGEMQETLKTRNNVFDAEWSVLSLFSYFF